MELRRKATPEALRRYCNLARSELLLSLSHVNAIAAMGGYRTLFAVALVLVVLGALCVRPIRSVR